MNWGIEVVGYGLVVVVILQIGWALRDLFRAENSFTRLKLLYEIVSTLYIMGLGLKLSLLGPDFVRFYLSDFSFQFTLPSMFSTLLEVPRSNRAKTATMKTLRKRRHWIVVTLIISITYELTVPHRHGY